MDMYSGAEAAVLDTLEYFDGDSEVALGYNGASAEDIVMLEVGRANAQVSTTWRLLG
jgi:hypothetical protein